MNIWFWIVIGYLIYIYVYYVVTLIKESKRIDKKPKLWQVLLVGLLLPITLPIYQSAAFKLANRKIN